MLGDVERAETADRARHRSSRGTRHRHRDDTAPAARAGRPPRSVALIAAMLAMLRSSTKKCAAISTTPTHARIPHGPRMDRRDRAAIGMADQHGAPHARRVEHARQHLPAPRRACSSSAAAGSRDPTRHSRSANRRTRRSRSPRPALREIAPQRDAAQALMQQHKRRRFVGPGPHHAVSSVPAGDDHPAASTSRSRKRWILPVAVFGRPSTNSIQRGYFHTPIRSFTCVLSSPSASPASWSPRRLLQHHERLGLGQPVLVLRARPPPPPAPRDARSALPPPRTARPRRRSTFSISSVRPWKR